MQTTRESLLSVSLRTTLLLATLMGLLVGAGFLIGGPETALLFLVFGIVFQGVMLLFSDRIALAMSRAQPLSREEAPAIYEMTEELSQRAGIPAPSLYRIPQEQPNAFATGRGLSRSAVALTEGIMKTLPPEELRGVIAHELAHIKHRDVLVQSVAAAIGGAVSYLGYMVFWIGNDSDSPLSLVGALLLSLLAPIAAGLVQMAVSRQREYGADARGAALTGNPEALASALLRISGAAETTPMSGHVSPSSEPLYIVRPFQARGLSRLFSTHPPIEERVERLRVMRPSL
jgi:heat shock protein HtpX